MDSMKQKEEPKAAVIWGCLQGPGGVCRGLGILQGSVFCRGLWFWRCLQGFGRVWRGGIYSVLVALETGGLTAERLFPFPALMACRLLTKDSWEMMAA